jgi:hypothetical protein
MTSEDGASLPQSFFRDAALYVNGTDGIIDLRRISITNEIVTVNLGTVSDPAKYVGSFTLNTENEQIELRDKYNRCCGFLLHSKEDSFLNVWAQGDHVFKTGAAHLETVCHIPVFDHGLTGFLVNDEIIRSGDLQLVGTRGVCIQQEGNVFTFNYTGEPLYDRYITQKQGNKFTTPRVLRQLIIEDATTQVTAYPDEYGTITLIGQNVPTIRDALRITTDNTSIRIELAAN